MAISEVERVPAAVSRSTGPGPASYDDEAVPRHPASQSLKSWAGE